MLLLTIMLIHVLVTLTATKFWMRPLMLNFDNHYSLKHCKDSDFLFFCFTWSLVLVLMGIYVVWYPLVQKRRNKKS